MTRPASMIDCASPDGRVLLSRERISSDAWMVPSFREPDVRIISSQCISILGNSTFSYGRTTASMANPRWAGRAGSWAGYSEQMVGEPGCVGILLANIETDLVRILIQKIGYIISLLIVYIF